MDWLQSKQSTLNIHYNKKNTKIQKFIFVPRSIL